MNTSFFGELLQTISERGRGLLDRRREPPGQVHSESLADLCESLLTGRGEASGTALAREILQRYEELKTGPRIAFFEALATRFGPDRKRLDKAMEAFRVDPSDVAAHVLHIAAEPRRQELFRRLNLAPHGTAALVRMREHLLAAMTRRPDLEPIDADFRHLFASWFNRGFLVLRRIDWSTPAVVLERIIRYEAVHEIRDWNDLRARIDPPDRRCYAFFHPALVDDPLIFVEVALTREIPGAIGPILATEREPIDPERATTAVFYSISNCQRGLASVSFGSFLIKQVVADISRDFPRLTTFVTLSPAPNFASWLKRERVAEASMLSESDRVTLARLDEDGWWENKATLEELRDPMMRAAANYYMNGRDRRGRPVDSVARFHLGNGARLERLDWPADLSARGRAQSYGLMVNYLYDLGDIEQNHEAYAESRTVIAANAVKKLAKAPRALVPTKLIGGDKKADAAKADKKADAKAADPKALPKPANDGAPVAETATTSDGAAATASTTAKPQPEKTVEPSTT
ncbi:MCD, Malonyl-CoA decarboxylase MCD [Rhodoplanes elegans]|uniref:MCD, Malonyl-CoA decarboxylase MCD n=1 Tax=Rhodoplanes elegans TaxID=29408 RepID=A0A327K5S6_9BRAD|nr:malonyl-CoA decarboxylase [Rhodoplanes elegans]MBK5961554.1 MCD, Malonyl-CoA decarboxylase MCD [Rhodoplanes elegans]RAI33083.1 MCD, Malonyl-CoA decarboxylase MCD [Rhodoplanes elegans]